MVSYAVYRRHYSRVVHYQDQGGVLYRELAPSKQMKAYNDWKDSGLTATRDIAFFDAPSPLLALRDILTAIAPRRYRSASRKVGVTATKYARPMRCIPRRNVERDRLGASKMVGASQGHIVRQSVCCQLSRPPKKYKVTGGREEHLTACRDVRSESWLWIRCSPRSGGVCSSAASPSFNSTTQPGYF